MVKPALKKIRAMAAELSRCIKHSEQLGPRASIAYSWAKLFRSPKALKSVHPRAAAHPLLMRPATSDINVFSQIFIEDEYQPLKDLKDVKSIIDLGANVGYSSAYFLSAFPGSSVIAVEPDPANFDLLQRNMTPYGDRAATIQAGIWSHPTRLSLVDTIYRDGRQWTRQVEERAEGGTISGTDIPTLQRQSKHDRTSLLKIDIEGSEAVLFGRNCQPWLKTVDAIAIELHDNSIFGKASDIFFAAIEGHGFAISHSRELVICRR